MTALSMNPMKRQPEPMLWTVDEIIDRLGAGYGPARAPRAYDPLAELIYTVLSQHTADANSVPAYRRLMDTFGTWQAIAGAPSERVVQAVRQGGLAQIKGPRIQEILRRISESVGSYDLSFLAAMPMEKARAWLLSLPGVGPKTAACVLLFSLGMPALPVDTHIYRVARRLGLIDPMVTPDRAHDRLEKMLTPEQVLPFHMYLITHGRQVCKAPRPLCERCILEPRCPASLLRPGVPATGGRIHRKKDVAANKTTGTRDTAGRKAD